MGESQVYVVKEDFFRFCELPSFKLAAPSKECIGG